MNARGDGCIREAAVKLNYDVASPPNQYIVLYHLKNMYLLMHISALALKDRQLQLTSE